MALTLAQITDALQISRSRVEQWISRGYFRTPDRPILGKARDWDVGEAVRLALCAECVDAQISPEQAGLLTRIRLHRFKDDTAYFVAWQGWHEMAGVRKDGKHQKAYTRGAWFPEIKKGGQLLGFLENSDVELAVVINIDNLEKRVTAALKNNGAVPAE